MSDDASRALVQAAARADRLHVLVRGIECAAAGSVGGSIVFATGLASGALVATSLLTVSVTIAAMTASLAWRERTPRIGDAARRADRAAGLDGALTAVLDGARAQDRGTRLAMHAAPTSRASDVASLLADRVRAAVGPRELARAAMPRTPAALVGALFAAALVVAALDLRPDDVPPRAGIAARLRDASDQSRGAGVSATADALEIAARRVASVEDVDDQGAFLDHPERERVRAELERLARTLPPEDPARRALDQAALALGAEPGDRAQVSDSTLLASATSSGTGAASQDGAGGSEEPGSSAGSSPALANSPGDGRMLGPPAGGESDPQSGGPASGTVATGGPGRGVPSARWWPSRYDAVVERYLTP